MARFAYWSSEGSTLAWARRLMDEGNEVLVFIKADRKNKVGQGIVPIATSNKQWVEWGFQDPRTIFLFDSSGNGDQADRLRKAGRFTIGGGKFMDRLEKERKWSASLAEKCGIQAPPTKSFGSITETLNYLNTNPTQEFGDGGWAWKPEKDIGCDATIVAKNAEDIIHHVEQLRRRHGDALKCILQEKIDGVAVSTAQWWNGKSFVGPIEGTIENKKFMDKNLGAATGCSFDLVWFYRDVNTKIAQALKWNKVAEMFRQNEAPPGLYDINSILDSRTAWFLEWTPRLGIDSELTSFRGISNLGQFLENLVMGKDVEKFFDTDQIYCDIHLSVPPYPNVVDLPDYTSPAEGVSIRGIDGLWDKMFVCAGIAFDTEIGIHCADPCGTFGFCISSGTSLKKTYNKMYDWIKENLKVPDLQYRTDAVETIQKDIDDMIKHGWELTPVLRK